MANVKSDLMKNKNTSKRKQATKIEAIFQCKHELCQMDNSIKTYIVHLSEELL